MAKDGLFIDQLIVSQDTINPFDTSGSANKDLMIGPIISFD